MHLNKIAQTRMGESFSAWVSGDTFVENAFKGRVHLTDRFLSIYNRPTRKRQLFVRPGTKLPETYVMRHQSTGEVYILGNGRQDARDDVDGGKAYSDMYILHLCTPTSGGSSGLAIQKRKVPKGPPENPGWLVEEVISETFIDMEFRTSSAEEGIYDTKTENFYAWTPITVEAFQHDVFELDGRSYRVVDTFTDAGMRGLRLDRERDNRVDFTITFTGPTVYNKDTYKMETTSGTHNVTGTVREKTDLALWRSESRTAPGIEVVIEEDHIGFIPKPNMKISYQGKERIIKDVASSVGDRQFSLVCE